MARKDGNNLSWAGIDFEPSSSTLYPAVDNDFSYGVLHKSAPSDQLLAKRCVYSTDWQEVCHEKISLLFGVIMCSKCRRASLDRWTIQNHCSWSVLRGYKIGFPNPAFRHYLFFLSAILLTSDVSSGSRHQNSFLSRQSHFFPVGRDFCRLALALQFGLCSR